MLETYVTLQSRLDHFLTDESGGERDTLTTLLILALIIIPLVLVIIAFGEEIKAFAESAWGDVMGSGIG